MQINIKVSKNFTTQWNKLQNEFGTQLADLNGFGDEQLSYGDFIDNFVDVPVVADSSIDSNSNVRRKDMVTLLSEMPKPHRKLMSFQKIYYEMQKAYNEMEEKRAKEEKREPELMPEFSAHHLRHTFCTRLCENETNIKVIQEIMGHKDIQTTMDIYAEATVEKKQEVVNSLQGKIIIR